MDINWRGFVIEGPVLVDSEKYGKVDINQPYGLFETAFPDFAGKLLNTDAKRIVTEPLLDFTDLREGSMTIWHSLFDPSFTQESVRVAIKDKGIGSAKVVSVYSRGECSIREGCAPPKEADAEVVIDGIPVKVHISTPTPVSQIEIAGFTSIEKPGVYEIIRVDLTKAPPVIPGFTLQVVLIFGGMMAAIAIVVLFKTRK
jgi:hypothetical protein